MKRLAIFASGFGSNFQAIVENQNFTYEASLLICDKENAYCIERAKNLNIQCYYINPKEYENKEKYELEIIKYLEKYNIDFIALAGYMRLIGPTLLNAYNNKIVNIHPSLLPAFMGKDAILQAIKYGVKVTGVTVHFVDSGMDTGKIIEQVPFYIKDGMEIEDIEREIHKIEHKLYPEVLHKIFS